MFAGCKTVNAAMADNRVWPWQHACAAMQPARAGRQWTLPAAIHGG